MLLHDVLSNSQHNWAYLVASIFWVALDILCLWANGIVCPLLWFFLVEFFNLWLPPPLSYMFAVEWEAACAPTPQVWFECTRPILLRLLLFLVSASKAFEMIQFSHSCGWGGSTQIIICLESEKDPTLFKTLNKIKFLKLTNIRTFGTLTAVVKVLLLGHVGSLPSNARIFGRP